MEIYIRIIFFILGLCVGSFLNMGIFRTAKRYGITNFKLRITNRKIIIKYKNRIIVSLGFVIVVEVRRK